MERDRYPDQWGVKIQKGWAQIGLHWETLYLNFQKST